MTDRSFPIIDITDLLHDRREITVGLTVRGQEVELPLAYNPGVFTDEFMRKFGETSTDVEAVVKVLERYDIPAPEDLATEIMEALRLKQDASRQVTEALADCVLEIGIGIDGKSLETAEEYGRLGVAVRGELFRAIMADMNPDAAKNGSTAPTAKRAPWAKGSASTKTPSRKRHGRSFGAGS